MANTNINANRVLTGATSTVLDIPQLVIDSQRAGVPPSFQRAVVEEVVFNPKALTQGDLDRIRAAVANSTAVDTICSNSVIATLISDGLSNATPTKVLLAPFFQSHLMLPVQVGEQVTVLFEDIQKYGLLGGKWVTRSSEALSVEDPNFTHSDRRFSSVYRGTTRTSSSSGGRYSPEFPNGGGADNTNSLPQDGSTNPFEVIYQRSIHTSGSSALAHSYEVVPRWTKRPQEFVIQGMNNALIMVGQDRTGYVTGSLSSPEQKDYAGTIDIVAGRGRFQLLPSQDNASEIDRRHKRTSPLVSVNTRGLEETDKTPVLSGRQQRLTEGDPDFLHDAARIYVSMKTQGDANFRLQRTESGAVNSAMQETGINYSTASLYPTQPQSSSLKVGTSYVVGKADNLRFVARRSDPREDTAGDGVLSGSILLLKEGKNRTPEDRTVQAASTDHLAYLFITPEGRVQVDGMQIFLGGAALRTDNQYPPPDVPLTIVPPGTATTPNMAEISPPAENLYAGAEPFIKWSEFRRVVEGLHQQINDLQDMVSGLVQDLNAATGGSSCVPFGPDTAWVPLAQSAGQRNAQLENHIAAHRTETNEAVFRARSAKVFGS